MDSIERVVGGVNRHSCKPVTKRLHISGQIKISQIIRRSICLLAAFTIAQINITSVYAATDDFIDKFAANNIMFYNPEECKSERNNSDCISSDGSNLSVIGDSISEGIKTYMTEKFEKLSLDDYDSLVGRAWNAGLTKAESMKLKDIVLFIHGTNNFDPLLTQADINNAYDKIGADKTIVFVTNYIEGKDLSTNNNLFKKAAEEKDNVIVVDWYDAVSKHKEWLEPDGIHPADAGQKELAEMIHAALNTPCARDGLGKPENATLITSMNRVTFYSSDASENGGYAGKNASSKYNEGKLALGQVAESNDQLTLGDLVYVEVPGDGEGSFANGKYFLVTDTGPTANTLDVFHDPASENTSAPFGAGKNAKIYKVKSGVSWEDYLKTYFWEGGEEPSGESGDISTGNNKDYEGNQILADDTLEKIKENQSVYEEAAQKVGIPWQILAVLHLREHSLLVDNPSNGQGIYQLYSYTAGGTNGNAFLPAGPVSKEEFLRQSVLAAEIFKKNEPEFTVDSTGDIVKRAFFKYNGTAGAYKTQARDLGFSEEEAENGEGSPYVMNKADEKRDPAKNPNGWGQIKTDGGSMSYPANSDYGAYVVFVALGGGTGNFGTCSSGSGGGNMDITATAIELAWKREESGFGGLDPNDAYRKAIPEVGLSTYGDAQVQRGSSCDAFVTTVYRYSGVDPDFYCCGTSLQLDWLLNNSKYEHVSPNTTDTSVLQTGDILILDGHIKLYIEIDGVGHEAQASYGDHSGQITEGVSLIDSIGRGTYQIFRFKG